LHATRGSETRVRSIEPQLRAAKQRLCGDKAVEHTGAEPEGPQRQPHSLTVNGCETVGLTSEKRVEAASIGNHQEPWRKYLGHTGRSCSGVMHLTEGVQEVTSGNV